MISKSNPPAPKAIMGKRLTGRPAFRSELMTASMAVSSVSFESLLVGEGEGLGREIMAAGIVESVAA